MPEFLHWHILAAEGREPWNRAFDVPSSLNNLSHLLFFSCSFIIKSTLIYQRTVSMVAFKSIGLNIKILIEMFFCFNFFIHLREWSSDTKLNVMSMHIHNTPICDGVYFASHGFYITHLISSVCNGSVHLNIS